jgi:hypothetical protein
MGEGMAMVYQVPPAGVTCLAVLVDTGWRLVAPSPITKTEARRMAQGKLGDLFARCWKDEAFKKRFLAEPASVLEEEGFDVPEGVKIKVIENRPDEMTLVLPFNPASPELSDAEMDQVAGGGFLRRTPQVRRGRIPLPTADASRVCAMW